MSGRRVSAIVMIISACTAPPTATSAPTVEPTVAVTTAPTLTADLRATFAPPLSDRYGVIVEWSPPFVRSEVDPRHLVDLRGEFLNGSVSPDGRALAYWESYRTGGGSRALHVIDGGAPSRSRVLLTLPEGEVAATSTFGGVVWSTDSKGLLIAVNSRDHVPSTVPDAAWVYTTLRQVDVATAHVREIARRAPGFPYFPIAWDRARGVSIAVSWGPGGFTFGYEVFRDGTASAGARFPVSTLPRGVVASPTADHILMRPFFDETRALHVWPVADPTKPVVLEPRGDERVVAALWRNDREIVVSLSLTVDREKGDRLEIWSLDGGRRVIATARHRLDAVRPDGTAAITDLGVVDLTSGAVARIPDLGPFQRVLASVIVR